MIMNTTVLLVGNGINNPNNDKSQASLLIELYDGNNCDTADSQEFNQ